MAVVFQEALLLDTSVAENVATGLKLRGVARAERERRVSTWLERFGIAHLARRSARSLSGGEAQRVSLARAFALDPEALLLDEPFSALDAPTRAAVTADLMAVVRSTQTTTVMVTHDLDEALALGDRVGVLIGGQLRQIGPPEEVFATPADAEVAGFVGVETIVSGVVVAQDEGRLRSPVLAAVDGYVRPADPGVAHPNQGLALPERGHRHLLEANVVRSVPDNRFHRSYPHRSATCTRAGVPDRPPAVYQELHGRERRG